MYAGKTLKIHKRVRFFVYVYICYFYLFFLFTNWINNKTHANIQLKRMKYKKKIARAHTNKWAEKMLWHWSWKSSFNNTVAFFYCFFFYFLSLLHLSCFLSFCLLFAFALHLFIYLILCIFCFFSFFSSD